MSTPQPTNPKDVSRINVTPPIGEEQKKVPQGPSFQSYMQNTEPNSLLGTKGPSQVSPFDLAHGQVPPAGPTINTLLDQAKFAQSALGDVSNQLNTPNLKLRQSTRYILKNKLSSAKAHIRSASVKMGADTIEDSPPPAGKNPLNRFFSLVTDGQNQLEEAQGMLQSLKDKGQGLTPGDMLLIQVKLNKAQQEIEYSSLLLSKAVDDMKMLMNIQL